MNSQAIYMIHIDDDAARILRCAAKSARAILDRRAAMDREGKADQPLVVLMGESHALPAHSIHFALVMEKLRQKEKVAGAFEQPHNLLEMGFRLKMKRAPGKDEAARLKAMDERGVLSLKTALGSFFNTEANQAHEMLLRYHLERGIAARFTDVSRYDQVMDGDDPSTTESLKACFEKAAALDCSTRAAMKVRNHHMAKSLRALARESGARIVLQDCGILHAAGGMDFATGQLYETQESLSRQLKAQGVAVLAMPDLYRNFRTENLPRKTGLGPHELFPVAGLPQIRADYDAETDQPAAEDTQLHNRAEEAAYINAILRRVGLSGASKPPENYVALKKELRAETKGIFLDCGNGAPGLNGGCP